MASPPARLASVLLGLILAGAAHAQSVLPTGGHVSSGSATIAPPAGNTLTINQSSQRAVINWNSFSVGPPDIVDFVQPGVSAAILNRVTGATTSTIAGQIDANGQVYLVNPNGIAITSTGSVQVGGGFVASTLGITDSNFMSGNLSFTGDGASAGVSNAGSITAGSGGYVGLIGGTAANSGVISVPLGKVALGSGEAATLDLNGDGFMQVAAPTGTTTAQGQALVSNSGKISAAGGVVQLQAATVASAIRDAVNMSGVIAANTVSGQNGSITLSGGPGGAVNVTGTLNASGYRPGTTGGTIKVTGNSVGLAATAKVHATGKAGGGTVEIGGGPHGADPSLADAQDTTVAAGALIDASATQSGNGGTVSVWSDGTTQFNGTILAQGGPNGGNGGWVETSGQTLGFTGHVDVSAPYGALGTILLDPLDLDIVATGANNGDVTATGVPVTSPDQNSDITVSASALTALNGNLLIDASRNLTIDAPMAFTNQTAGETIEFFAGNNITINQPVTSTGAQLVFTAAALSDGVSLFNNANPAGGLTINAAVGNSLTGDIIMSSGTGGIALGGSITTASSAGISLFTTGAMTQSAGIITTGSLSANSGSGMTLDDANMVGNLNAANTASGNLSFTNDQSLTVPSPREGLGVVNLANAGAITLTVNNGGTLATGGGVMSTDGTITLAADAMNLGGEEGVNAGTARVILEPATSGQAIALGSTPAGVLGLPQSGLDAVTAGVLQIGGPATGAITVTGAITNPTGINVLTLVNNGTIGEQSGATLSVPDLRVSSTGPVTLDQANNIQVVAANTTNAVTIANGAGNALTVGTVDGISGIATGNNAITLTADSLTINQPINAGSSTATIAPATAGKPVDIGTLVAAGDLLLSPSELGGDITAGTLVIGDSSSGMLTVNQAFSPSNVANLTLNSGAAIALQNAITIAGGTLTLTAGGAITETTGGIVDPGSLAITSAGPVTMGNANAVDTLAASLNGSGDAFLFDNAANPLTVGAVNGVTGITTNNGNVTLSVMTSGGLTISNPISAGTGSVTAASVGNLALNSTVSGNAIILATNGNFTNTAGPFALLSGGGNRWLVYSTNPADDTDDGLMPAFIQFAATYDVGTLTGTPPLGSGNGLLYSGAPFSFSASLDKYILSGGSPGQSSQGDLTQCSPGTLASMLRSRGSMQLYGAGSGACGSL